MTELLESIGGLEGCRRLSTAFYGRVARDKVLRPFFPSLHCAVEALARFLAQFLGGPCVYSEQRWYLSLRGAHQRFRIGERERAAWMCVMRAAMAETNMPAAGAEVVRLLVGVCRGGAGADRVRGGYRGSGQSRRYATAAGDQL